ncbi:alpha/beta fold hydrolase [Pusillimonas sp. SM2304]|uniref:alpha/beta fold hydrolase n=1 Tax=Pusillimonas sp. SM2304 TaxID=3073241 RepID=UPI002876D76B|nr:alpha/beta fold hydrolase [Pusillimonas sp. SM2304]MDS1142464.1 alpha/beta fold hydrolase [Pusillimonas sp. SM2304]
MKTIKSYFVGGRPLQLQGIPAPERVRVPGERPVALQMNGMHMVGQMYAQHFCLQQPQSPYPVVLIHGGGLSGSFWESDAYGEEGWLHKFLRAGFDTVVTDAFERGRSGFPAVPHVLSEAPHHRTLEEMWHAFRLGPVAGFRPGDLRHGHAGQQFPVERFEWYAQRFVPRWTNTEQQTLAAYEELIRQLGPCMLVGHSQGAFYSLMLAQRLPDTVRRVVAIEPPAVPEGEPACAYPPHLAVWGDYISQSEMWVRYRAKHVDWAEKLACGGGPGHAFIDLPAENITGNSHLIVPDRNNQKIFERILRWVQG